MLKTLFKGRNNLQYIIKNQIKHNRNNLERLKFLPINSEMHENIEKYILTTQICSFIGATGGVIIYGGDALMTNLEKNFLVHFIETMKGSTLGFIYGAWIGFFWPVTAFVLMIRCANLFLIVQHKLF
jgi:hypothetical protein